MSDKRYETDRGSWTGPSPDEIAARVIAAGPSAEHWQRFAALRAELFQAIATSLAEDGHCKSYEGALAIHCPNYFEDKAATEQDHGWLRDDAWGIELHCYLLGPNRHYRWAGSSFEEVLHKAETDIRAWINDDYSLRHDERR